MGDAENFELEWIKLRKEMYESEKERNVTFGSNSDILLNNPVIGIGFFLTAWSFLRGLSVIGDDKKTLRMMFSRLGFQAIAFGAFAYALHQKMKKDVARYKELEDNDKLYN